MSFVRRIEQFIDGKTRQWLTAQGDAPATPELLEIHRALLDDVAQHVQALRRGKLVFPYNRLQVTIVVPEPERRPVFQAAFTEGSQFREEVAEAVRAAGAEVPADLQVSVSIAETPTPETQAKGFGVVYQHQEAAPVTPVVAPAPIVSARLTVLTGDAVPTEFVMAKEMTHLGRLAEVMDQQQRLVRRNDVAFADVPEAPNNTVSRLHATIRYDRATGQYRLFDDGSAYGTSLLRQGQVTPIPAGVGPGVRLQSGDEIYLGQARLRFD